ncbi:hypothetical protein OsJ_18896 [Oryza sativa Japonica Group]|uniref:Uncharacterized protein n=1 Tax=Oryza sativa subsp. japonica TaxID=39947 RepID=B9FKQ6_ORYSJ|nr:hypothetical protein OsJ_18896 [Oryza sativa Japonica Group]
MARWLKEAKEMEVLECMGQAARRPGSHGKDEAQRVWEAEMAHRLKETEELQSWAATEAPTKSEEEKRKRVHRKLEKLHRPTSPATTPPILPELDRLLLGSATDDMVKIRQEQQWKQI